MLYWPIFSIKIFPVFYKYHNINHLTFEAMKTISCSLFLLLFFAFSVSGQFSEKNIGSGIYIGCENMDNDPNKEIVLLLNTNLGDCFSIIDGVTGVVENTPNYEDIIYKESVPFGGNPKLVDSNSDGVYEIIFKGYKLSTDLYAIHLISFNGSSGSNQIQLQKHSSLDNYPNPFSGSTTIRYNVPTANIVTIKLFDMNGRLIRSILKEQKDAGDYEINFKSENIQTGTYFYQIQIGDFTDAQKMLVIK